MGVGHRQSQDNDSAMKALILFIGWGILFVLCWPLALLALNLFLQFRRAACFDQRSALADRNPRPQVRLAGQPVAPAMALTPGPSSCGFITSALRPCNVRGLPRWTPRCFAAAMPASTRSWMMPRSSSATAMRTPLRSNPAGGMSGSNRPQAIARASYYSSGYACLPRGHE